MEEKRQRVKAESGTKGKGKKTMPGDEGEVGMRLSLTSAKLVPGKAGKSL